MFRTLLINTAIRLLDTFLVSKITYQPAKVYVKENYDRLKKVADLLTDKNPDDAAQLQELWQAEKLDLMSDSVALKRAIISKEIKSEELKATLLDLLNTIEEAISEQLAIEAPQPAK